MSTSIATLRIDSQQRSQMIEITSQVKRVLGDRDVRDGRVTVYVPHTTAGVTINENADPDVVHDMLAQLDAMVPWTQPFYRHGEGNSAAHVKASMMGSSVVVLIRHAQLMLGRWQGIYLCEFDGPRTREVHVMIDGVAQSR
jgi:secondary thiamine-phosphate synthase enzyme